MAFDSGLYDKTIYDGGVASLSIFVSECIDAEVTLL